MRFKVSRLLTFLFPAMLLAVTAPPLTVQANAPEAVSMRFGDPATALNGPWKFRTDDSPKIAGTRIPLWAQPDLDDSGWQNYTIDPKKPNMTAVEAVQSKDLPGWQQHGHPGYTGYAWYRIRLKTQPGASALAVLMPTGVDDAYEIFFDGQEIGSFGKLDGRRIIYQGRSRLFPIPGGLIRPGQPVTLAVRFWDRRSEASSSEKNMGGGLRGVPILGPEPLLRIFQQSLDQRRLAHLPSYAWGTLALDGAVGLISLFLFFFSRSQREYLWAAITLLCLAGIFGLAVAIQYVDVNQFLIAPLFGLGFSVGISAAPLALMYLLGVPKTIWRRGTAALFALLASSLALNGLLDIGVVAATRSWNNLNNILQVISSIAICLLLLGIATDGLRTLGKKAWLPLSPAVFLAGLFVMSILAIVFPKFLGIAPSVDAVLFCCFPLAVLVVFLLRFTQQQRENAQMTSELEAARSMQSLLVPATPPNTQEFAVESVYIPASQVGGDFFQILPGGDGSLLIVIGDVSGKGLKAAMTVSMIVGALRGCSLREPAEVLAYSNRVLYGRIGGFVTCCAALIQVDGALTIANAGHLSPYRSGEELPVPGGMPLGMLADVSYDETQYQLAPGDRLTFISDGVVEARNQQGELYGFERTQQISNQPASAIAQTAKGFGQEDDITVVTLLRSS